MESAASLYWKSIADSVQSLWTGLKLTLAHLYKSRISRKPLIVTSANYFEKTQGINTVQYPHEMQPVPDNGRYRLHNEIDDCIVCDKCAKICPVDCITIDPIKAVEEIGKTSDGTPKRIYAAKFDIDMGTFPGLPRYMALQFFNQFVHKLFQLFVCLGMNARKLYLIYHINLLFKALAGCLYTALKLLAQ